MGSYERRKWPASPAPRQLVLGLGLCLDYKSLSKERNWFPAKNLRDEPFNFIPGDVRHCFFFFFFSSSCVFLFFMFTHA